MTPNQAIQYLEQFDPKPSNSVKREIKRYLTTISWLPEGPKKILDLGSDRHFVILLSKLRPEYEIYTQGISQTRGAAKDSSRVESTNADLKQFRGHEEFDVEKDLYPYQDDFFDIVLSMELIEHLTHDPMQMIKESNRILKKDGLLMLTTPNLMSWRSAINIIEGRYPMEFMFYCKNQGITQHVREYLPWELERSFKEAGFKGIRLKTYSFSKARSLRLIEKAFVPFFWIMVITTLRHPKFLKNRGAKIFIGGKKERPSSEDAGKFLYWIDGYSENIW